MHWQILGIRNQSENLAHHKVPQFMMELYNTVTDSSGDTQSQNPYNAKLVRSFIERGNFRSFFDPYFRKEIFRRVYRKKAGRLITTI